MSGLEEALFVCVCDSDACEGESLSDERARFARRPPRFERRGKPRSTG